jgi:hypothetical protein
MIRDVDIAQLSHRHGDEWSPMIPREHPNPAEADVERTLLRGGRIFRCSACDTEIAVGGGQAPEEPVEAGA